MLDTVLGTKYTTVNGRYKVVRLVEMVAIYAINNKVSYNHKCCTDTENAVM